MNSDTTTTQCGSQAQPPNNCASPQPTPPQPTPPQPWHSWARVDWVVILTLSSLVIWTLIDYQRGTDGIVFALDSLLRIAPLIALSAILAAYIKASSLDQQIALAFSSHPVKSIVLASLFGGLSPFCSCGVVALIAGLLRAGVPLAPVMAFWLTSPLMDPEMFILTAAILGLPFATAKLIFTIAIGVIAGFIALSVQHLSAFNPILKASKRNGDSRQSMPEKPVWKIWTSTQRRNIFKSESIDMSKLLFKWLSLAYVLEALMLAYAPANSISNLLGSGDWWVIPVSSLVGVPAYLNGYAALPLISGLIEQGMQPGAAMAFIIAGGISSIPAAMAVLALVRKPIFALYLLLGLIMAITAGYSYQWMA